MIEIMPFIITLFLPKLCYGCTKIGQYQQKLNNKYSLAYINWFAYLLLLIFSIYYIFNNFKNNIYLYILLCIFLIFLPVFPLLNIINIFLSLLYQNPSFIHNYHDVFPSSKQIEKNADLIIQEFKKYNKNNISQCLRESNPGFTIENTILNDKCWRTIQLKKQGIINNHLINNFPITLDLLKDKQIHNAIFSILDPGVEIPAHIGYYKGYLRYHMGIIIPNNDLSDNDNKAYIVCGDEKYIWKEKEGIVFDDMYLHHVKNPTNQLRVVLYLDIIRNSNNIIVNIINDFGIYLIENSIALKIILKNQHKTTKIE